MRRRAKKENVGVALFPFLAVLICTMGALIVLLVMNVQQASLEAKTIAAQQAKAREPDPAEIKKQQEALEEARWRQEVLEQQRKERQDVLQEARLALSHLEDHIRRLNAKGKELMELLEKVKAGKQSKEQDLAATRAELAKIKDELAKKKDELAKKKKETAAAEKWYALIPYDGPNGTRRMPIYIECVAEGIVIQPEGVLLTADDFRGEPSPGNPLDAALRTKREYIMKATGGNAAEPYPLLVVRPSGVLAYGAARACMRFWEDEFGYELISEDKNLDFGPRDPNLDQIMSREIAQARKRQAVMATAMPRKYTREEVPRSFAPEDNPEVVRRRAEVAGSGVGNGGSGNGFGGGSGGTGAGGLGTSGTGPGGKGLAGANGTGPGGVSSGGVPGMSGAGPGPYGSGGNASPSPEPGGLAGTGGTGAGTGGSGGDGPGGAGPGGSNPGGAANSGGDNPGSRKPGSPRLTQPNQGGSSSGGGSYADGSPGGTSESGGTSRPGSAGSQYNSQANAANGSASSGGNSGGSSGGASGGTAGGGGATGSPSGGQSAPNIGVNMGSADRGPPAGSQKSGKGRSSSNSQAKGKNWGLPEAQRHVSGVTRPIGVTILKDKLILQPERADQRRPQEIPLSPEMSPKELETLVSGVQRQMRSWGIALDGGYWRPALSVEVQPGAEDRFAELQSALQGSGIEVQRKIR